MANRRRQWQDFLVGAVIGVGSQSTKVLLRGDIDDTKGMTLVRMVIDLASSPDPTSAVVGSTKLHMGIGVFAAEAIAASSYADPNVETDQPMTGWLWRRSVIVTDDPSGPPAPWMGHEDIRSQRRVMYGSPVLILNADTGRGSSPSLHVSGLVRCLYLLE